MGAPEPEEIFEKSRSEGERRLRRPLLEVASTALAAGFDIAAGVILIAVLSAPLEPHFGKDKAPAACSSTSRRRFMRTARSRCS